MLGGEAIVGPYMPLKRRLILTFLKFVTLDYSLVIINSRSNFTPS